MNQQLELVLQARLDSSCATFRVASTGDLAPREILPQNGMISTLVWAGVQDIVLHMEVSV